MPVLQQTPYISYTGNGSVKTFAYPFQILQSADLKVYKDGVEASSGFSVTGVGNSGGGSVVFLVAPANGVTVRLVRQTELSRDTDYVDGGVVTSDSLDNDFDRAVMMIQELDSSALTLNSSGVFSAENIRIEDVGTPVSPTDAATKQYVDATVLRNPDASKYREVFTATDGQTVFVGTTPFLSDSKIADVYVNGVRQTTVADGGTFTQSNGNTITFTTGLALDDSVEVLWVEQKVIDASDTLASTTQAGFVQLTDSVSTTSSTLAATATAVKTANDLAQDAMDLATAHIALDFVPATGGISYTGGSVIIGATAINGTFGPRLQITGDGASAHTLTQRSNTSVNPIVEYKIKSNGTASAPTSVASGDGVWRLDTRSHDGTNYLQLAGMDVAVDGPPATGSMPGRITFSTTASGSAAPTERMRIDSSGRVGIGLTPAYQFEVKTANDAILRFINNGATQTSQIQSTNLARGAFAPLSIGGSITILETGGNERVRVDASGNVGIGATPTKKLDVFNSGTTTTDFVIRNGTVSLLSFVDGGAGYFGTTSNHPLLFTTNNTEKMRINAGGGVGINSTASADVQLRLAGNYPASGGGSYPLRMDGTITNGATGTFVFADTLATLQATAFTCSTLVHYRARQAALSGGAAITNQVGFSVENTLTGGASNFGFFGDIPAGANRWNFYAGGTAQNYFAGVTGIGAVSDGFNKLYAYNTGPNTSTTEYASRHWMDATAPSGGVSKFAIRADGVVGTGWGASGIVGGISVRVINDKAINVSGSLQGCRIDLTNSSTGTLAAGYAYVATPFNNSGGAAVNAYYGYTAEATVIATENHGFFAGNGAAVTAGKTAYAFRSQMNTPTGGGTTWGLYFDGTAANYLNGRLLIGSTSPWTAGVKFYIDNTISSTSGSDYGAVINTNVASASGTGVKFGHFSQVNTTTGYGNTAAMSCYGGTFNHTLAATISDARIFQAYGQINTGVVGTISNLYLYTAQPAIKQSGTISAVYGYHFSNQVDAAGSYGFYSANAAGAGKWAFYDAGGANSAFSGNVRVGSTAAPTVALDVTGAIAATTSILSSGATSGIGYATGAGGTVTQATSKTTGVTLNKITGEIVTAASALNGNTIATFTLTNSAIGANDIVIVNRKSGGTAGAYDVFCDSVAAGSCVISIRNEGGGSLSESIVIQFMVIKSVVA